MRAAIIGFWLALMPVAALAQGTISVVGEGSAAQPPDMAVLTIGVSERDAQADAAMQAVSGAMAGLLDEFAALAIAPADLQTSGVYLSPVRADTMGGQAPRFAGFEATNTLTVRVRDLDTLPAVLEAAVAEGANRLSGLRFDIADPGPVANAARRAAVADAAAKAALYASAAGVTLGPVLSIDEAAQSAPRPMMAMEMARSAPIATGEAEITARVAIVYAIAD